MRKLAKGLATLAAIAAGMTMLSTRSDAAGLPGSRALSDAADTLAITESVQYFYGGRNWCWYDDGWQGPGFYWCGYRFRRGFGYGGGAGWRGWGGGPGWRRPGVIVVPGGGGWMGGGGGWMGGGGGFMGGGPGGFMGGGGGGGFMGGGPGGFMGGGGGGGFMGGGGGGGPMGFGGGGGMGGGGGGMSGFTGVPVSDIRAKHAVQLLGKLDNGLGFYRFSYVGSDKSYVGVMAQEVQSVDPKAVVHGSDGYMRVRYDRLGLKMQSYEDWVAGGEKLPTVTR